MGGELWGFERGGGGSDAMEQVYELAERCVAVGAYLLDLLVFIYLLVFILWYLWVFIWCVFFVFRSTLPKLIQSYIYIYTCI